MSLQYALARRTLATARSITCSRVILSLCSRWIAEVARKTWIRGLLGVLQGLPSAVDIAIIAPGEAADGRAGDLGGDGADGLEVALGGDREPGLDDVDPERGQAGPPPPSQRCSCSRPGDCSPSRKVVSKIRIRFASAMAEALPAEWRWIERVRRQRTHRPGETENPETRRPGRVSGLRKSRERRCGDEP